MRLLSFRVLLRTLALGLAAVWLISGKQSLDINVVVPRTLSGDVLYVHPTGAPALPQPVAVAKPPKAEAPVQRRLIRFPNIGVVEVTSWEKDGDVPRILFSLPKNGKLLRNIKWSDTSFGNEAFLINKSSEFEQPLVTFRTIDSPLGSVVIATGVCPGGSDGSLITYLIAEVGGQLMIINKGFFVNSYQGGMYFGYLGKKFGYGAVVWNFEWQESSAHYALHPFTIEVYKLNSENKSLSLWKHLRTKKYYFYATDPSAPLREFGLSGRDLLETMPRLEDRRIG
jgi:hypothetical protein